MNSADDMLDDESPSTDEIRADIERTRERLGHTVEALGTQLNPTHLTQRVKASVREATIGRVQDMARNTTERVREGGRIVVNTVRENPVPAAMIAAGIGWMVWNSRSHSSTTNGLDTNAETWSPEPEEPSRMQRLGSTVSDSAQDVMHKAQDAGQRVAQTARDTTHRVAETARTASRRVADGARATSRKVSQTAQSAARGVATRYDESPLALGAIAIAAGLAIGLLLPATQKESEMLSATGDKLLDKARGVVSETTQKVERTVERAAPQVQSVIKDAAKEESLI